MDLFNKEDLRELAETQDTPCVSLFMPTYHVEAEHAQNPIRFKNLIRQARQRLKEEGHKENDIQAILGRAESLLENADYWLYASDGFAAFLTPERAHFFRLPVPFEELAVTARRFHLKPLFPAIATNNRFYVLALSQNKVRLFQGTHSGLNEVQATEIPDSIQDMLIYEVNERSVQSHTGNRAGGRQDAIFHGQGRQNDDDHSKPHSVIWRFFQQVDDGVKEALHEENAPLVLAGVEYYRPIYKEVNSYGNLVDDQIIAGNPDHLSLKELHAKAWDIVAPRFMASQQTSLERFTQVHQSGGLAADNLHEIVPAAVFGRIDTVFVPIGQHRWGCYDPQANTVELHEEQKPGDEDLLDLAAVHTFLHGGTVHALRQENMPSDAPLAATFRYPADVTAQEAG